jgi:hypothetical protein
MIVKKVFALLVLMVAASAGVAQDRPAMNARTGTLRVLPDEAQGLVALANNVRVGQGLKELEWDPGLASAALQHCLRMVSKGMIAHRYEGEADLSERAANAGAHFSMVAENVAQGQSAATIHQAWLDSPGHRANMLNPETDHVGIAVVAIGNLMFAVADFSRAEPLMTREQVEETFSEFLRAKGLTIAKDPTDARNYCDQPDNTKGFNGKTEPSFVVRWQSSDLSRLPQQLVERIDAGTFHQASVGTCAAQRAEGTFSVFRVAVLFYQ